MIATSQFTISVIKDGKDGAPGATGPQGISVEKVVREYRLSDSSTEMTGSGDGYTWSETKPDIPSGKYLWERERTDLSNNTSEYGTAHCDIVISGLVFDVDRNSNAITSKVWESDITTKINEYDGSTGAAIRDRVTQTETDISGINTTISDIQTNVANKADGSTVQTLTTRVNTISDTVDGHTQTISSNTSRIDDAEDEIESTKTIANQTANKFTWLVQSGTSASNFTLTSRVAELISPQVVIKDPAGSATIITGGKIQANSITTNMLKSDAIKSTNYTASSNASSPYSATGAFLDLNTGSLYMPNFGVNGTTGAAYFNGTVNANAGKFGDDTSYWNIETVYDYNMQPHAALVGTGSPYLQTGNWQVSDNAIATRKYTSTSESAGNATYYKDSDSNTFYDVGMKIPTNFGGYSANDSSVTRYNKAFYYGRKYTGNSIPSLDSDWTYFFEIDSGGNVITAGDVYEGGVKLSEKYAAITDVGSAYLPKTGGTITGNLTVNGSVTTNLMIQTNLASTSAAQLTGNANATVTHGVTGTLGVGNGGTGKSSWTANRLIYSSASNVISELGAGSSGQILKSNGSSAPSWVNQSALSVGTATKATQDGDGNVITTTYRTLDNGQFDTVDITDAQIGNLIVTGAARFTNGLYGDLTGNADTATTATTATTANKVEYNLKVQLNGGTTEGTNQFTYNGSAAKNINITKSSIGLGNVDNTADANKSVNYATTAGSATSATTATSATSATNDSDGNAINTTYVKKSGDTMTADLTLKRSTIDASKTNNNVSSTQYPTTFNIFDTANRILSRQEAIIYANGDIGSYWYVRNYNTSGSQVAQKGIRFTMNKSGTLTYDVSDSYAFRTAIELNNVTNNAQVKGLSSGTTSGHLVTWGADGYTVADSGIANTSVTTKITLAGSDYSASSNVITITQANLQSAVQSNDLKLMTAAERSKLSSIQVSEGGTIDFSGVTASSPLTATVDTNKKVNITHNTSGVSAGTYRSVTVNTYGHVTAGTNPTTLSGYGITDAKIASGVITLGSNTITPLTASSTLDATKLSGTASISTTGNAGTATKFATAQSVTLTGDTTGTASSQAGWSLATTTNAVSATELTNQNLNDYHTAQKTHFYFAAGGNTVTNKPFTTDSGFGVITYGIAGGFVAQEVTQGVAKWVRYYNNSTWSNWFENLTTNNYTSYTVKKDGTGATGTWGISVTGNAATATTSAALTGITSNRFVIGNGTSSAYASSQMSYFNNVDLTVASTTVKRNGIHIWGQTYGNDATKLVSQTAGVMSWGDGGPQITFNSGSATPENGQAGALIFTDHDSCGTGASFHFVSNQTDWNVNSKRFVAKTSMTVGANVPNTSYNLSVTGTANISGATTGASFSASDYISANNSSGTAGGVNLYNRNNGMEYAIMFRQTSNQVKHGFVQSDWATYLTMGGNASNVGTRGWIFKDHVNSKGVASISGAGNMALNGELAIGTTGTDVSGSCSLVMDRNLSCLNFVFN